MAQLKIRKFSPGGVLRTETGEVFTLEDVEKLVQENPTNENLKDIANELRAGRDVNHSISDNWSSVTSNDFTAGQQRRAGKGPNSLARRIGAALNTEVHRYGEDVSNTTAILSNARSARTNNTTTTTSETPSASDYTLISSGSGTFNYDDNGTYIENDFNNKRLMMLLKNLNSYLSGDTSTSYKFKGIGKQTRETLQEMYDADNAFLNKIMDKIRHGRIIEGSPEASLLLELGIGSNMTKAEHDSAVKEKALKDYFIGQGYTEEQFKGLLPFVGLDDQGLFIKSGVENSPFRTGENVYYNNDYSGPYKDILNGKMIYNNRIYNAKDLANSGMISDWVTALREHRFADANQLIKWDWKGVANKYDYSLFDNTKYYNDFLNGKRYLDVTGQYEKQVDSNGNVTQIIGYYDPNDTNIYTELGFVDPSKIKYARFDSMGNVIDKDYNINLLRKAQTPWEHTTVFQERDANGQVRMPSTTTREGLSVAGMDVSFNPERGTVWFTGNAVRDVLGAGNGDVIELDGEVAKVFSPTFFQNVEKYADVTLRRKFKDTILSLVGNKFGNAWTRDILSRDEWEKLLRPTYGEDAAAKADYIFNYIAQYIGNPDAVGGRIAGAVAGTATGAAIGSGFAGIGAIPGSVIGGIVGLLGGTTGATAVGNSRQASREERLDEFTPRSYQQGGLFTGSAAATTSAPKVIRSDRYTPAVTEEAGAFEFGQFDDSDWWELGGLAADLGSVVTGLSGFTPASFVSGLAGTGASFVADIKRDGFQAKDLGNLGMGLLFDAASLIPGAGVGASSTKVMRAIKKGFPILMKLAGVAGVGSSLALAVNKIQSGEKMTMRDLRIIMNGVLGAYTMAKQGVDVTNRRKGDGAEINADLKKLHAEKIDASTSLSDGQKAALKQYFDPDSLTPGTANRYRDALTDQAQKDIFDRFIKDGGDDLALKMLLGDNADFKAYRADRDLLLKAQRSLAGQDTLTPDEVKRYDQLLRELNVTRTGQMTSAEYDALRNIDAQNDQLKSLLVELDDPATNIVRKAAIQDEINNVWRNKSEYTEFFKKWDALPQQARYQQLETELNNITTEYHAGMYKKNDPRYGHDEAWAAGVKERERIADDILAQQDGLKRASDDVDIATRERDAFNNDVGNKKLKNNVTTAEADYKAAKDARDTTKADFDASKTTTNPNGDPQKKAALDRKETALTKAKAKLDNAKAAYNPVKVKRQALQQALVDAKARLSAAEASKGTWQTAGRTNGDLVEDPTTGLFSKRTELVRDVNSVASQFTEVGQTRSAMEAELSGLRQRNTDDLDLEFVQQRERAKNPLFDELAQTRREIDDVVWDPEFSHLSTEDQKAVKEILNKSFDQLSTDDIALLNQYTSRAAGNTGVVVDQDVTAALDARAGAARGHDTFKNFAISDAVDVKDINLLLRASDLPNSSQLQFSELEWAQIKRSENPGLKISEILKARGVKNDAISEVIDIVSNVEKVAKNKSIWPWRKNDNNDTFDLYRLNDDQFTRNYRSDDSAWGKFLGRSAAQEAYKGRLYGTDGRPAAAGAGEPWRYYQPMVHGMTHVFRNPVHATPWYNPREINYNEEER